MRLLENVFYGHNTQFCGSFMVKPIFCGTRCKIPIVSTECSSSSTKVCLRISQAKDNPGIFLITKAPVKTRCGIGKEDLSPLLHQLV